MKSELENSGLDVLTGGGGGENTENIPWSVRQARREGRSSGNFSVHILYRNSCIGQCELSSSCITHMPIYAYVKCIYAYVK